MGFEPTTFCMASRTLYPERPTKGLLACRRAACPEAISSRKAVSWPLVGQCSLSRKGQPYDRFFQATDAAQSYLAGMDIHFIASIAVITSDPEQSRELFVDALGLPLEATPGSDYFHSEQIDGSKHFGVWPLSEAAQACFGTPDWPADRVVPQMSLEFEVGDADAVQSAAEELRQRGFSLLHDRREEPWGQTVARLQSEEGSIIGISFAPALHD
jgi:catechol 2,3-dioxygenase-like lactoylglutathione lyase family enzyme